MIDHVGDPRRQKNHWQLALFSGFSGFCWNKTTDFIFLRIFKGCLCFFLKDLLNVLVDGGTFVELMADFWGLFFWLIVGLGELLVLIVELLVFMVLFLFVSFSC